ncbi:MAG: hypothetical protein AB7P31_03400 [Steroidobacteraceae bacterium]
MKFHAEGANRAEIRATQIELHMQIQYCLGEAKFGLREHRQAHVDNRGIELVGRMVQAHPEAVGHLDNR